MAVQENTNLTTDFAKAQSIDFVNRFTGGIKKLQEMLGITHAADYSRTNYETIILTAPTLYAERLDGVVVGTISAE